jgi:copper(I)-binding protein
MTKFFTTLIAALLVSTNVFACNDHLAVSDAWARASAKPNNNSAAYMVLENTSDHDLVITKASAPEISDKVELHETFLDEKGVHKMTHVDKIVIPANSKIELKPKHTHIMFMGLKKELKAGDKFMLKLACGDAGEKDVEVEVRQLGK